MYFWRGERALPFSNLTDWLSGLAVTIYEVFSINKILPEMRGGWREDFHPNRSELPMQSETRCIGYAVGTAIQWDFLGSSVFPSQLGFRTLLISLFTCCPSCCVALFNYEDFINW